MRRLRIFRVALATIFFMAAALLALFPLWSRGNNAMLNAVAQAQIQPSALFLRSSLSVTAGVTLFWLALSFLFGRVYCSTLCPIGTLCDISAWAGRKARHKERSYRFTEPKNVRFSLLWIYLGTLVLGQLAFPFLVEPWNIWRNIFSTVNPGTVKDTWVALGVPAAVGMTAGVISLIFIVLFSLRTGRGFCTAICPIGTALGVVSSFSPTQIAIDPDRCISCMKCEEVCPSGCVKVVSRYVDNSRCVRCLDCLDVCPAKAIGFTSNRNRPASPLFMKQRKNIPS